MKSLYTTLLLTAAFSLGVIATAGFSGCKPAEPPPVEDADVEMLDIDMPGAEMPDGEDIGLPTEEAPSESPEAKAAPAESPEAKAAPAESPEAKAKEKPAVEKPAEAPAEKPSEEPAEKKPAEEKPAEEKPAEEKPAEEKPAEKKPSEEPAEEAAAKVEAKAPEIAAVDKSANAPIEPGDWRQWGGTSYRNNTPVGSNIPIDWDVGDFDRRTNEWISENARNIKWVNRLGSQTYGNPVVADGRVFVGTNNGAGWLKRYPSQTDLGCLLAFSEADGRFLWQDSSEKLPTGRVHDWPLQGICCAPYVEGNRLWYVTSRGEVKCLDTEGFHDGEDDGPVQNQWGRLFDLRQNEDPAQDQVAPATEALDSGSLTDLLRERFAASGVELPEEVSVGAGDEGTWEVKAQVGEHERTYQIRKAGPKLSAYKQITPLDKDEADVVWVYDMMSELQVSQHNMCSCSITAWGDILFINTSNGVDESHIKLPSPDAPSFIAMDKNTAEVYWTDGSPGLNILHGQWSSPSVAALGGADQVIFAGGDGWVYSFRADKGKDGKPELLWKFDANPKSSKWILGGRGTRNNIIGTPVIYDGLVYIAVGQDPEHGEGIGHVWCIDPTKRGDVSPELAMKIEDDRRVPIEHRRLQAIIPENGEVAVDNPNSAVVWHYSQYDQNGDGEFDFEETMHRSCGTVAIKDDLCFIADFSGLFHCLDAKTGKPHWTYDMLAAAWGSPLIVGGHVYIGDEDGDLSVFKLSADPAVAMKEVDGERFPINANDIGEVTFMQNSVYSTPVVANNVLYISNKTHLFAIEAQQSETGSSD